MRTHIQKKTVLTLVLLLSAPSVRSQIAVDSFRALENDLTAITNGTMETDQNGEVAALIKIVTTHRDFTFDGGMLGIVRVVVKPGEYWVYVPRKLMKITIAHPYLGILRDYYFPLPIEGARTYELVLRVGGPGTAVKRSSKRREMTLQVTPPNATLFIDGEEVELDEPGAFTDKFSVGNHTYYVEAADHKSESGVFEVKEDANEPFVIRLKSSQAKLTLNCADSEATIFIGGEEKGIGSWTGTLTAGEYAVEVRREKHESVFDKVELAEGDERTVTLAAPNPIYGFLHVEAEPAGATVYVDDKVVGVTPCDIDASSKILIGTHRIRITKDGYDTYSTTVTFKQEKDGSLLSNIRLNQSFEGTIKSQPAARLTYDGMDAGWTPYPAIFVEGKHILRLERKGYEVFEDTVILSPETPNPLYRLTLKPLSQTMFYVGAEVHAIGTYAADAVAGFYLRGLHGEACLRHPFSSSITGYYNTRSSDGTASEPHTLTFSPGFSLQGILGYGIRIGTTFRLTPAVGVRSTTLTGVIKDGSASNQQSYVLSGVGTIKAEYALTPSVSVVVTPEYVLPLKRNEFVSIVESVFPEIAQWYGGFGLNAGIHLNF